MRALACAALVGVAASLGATTASTQRHGGGAQEPFAGVLDEHPAIKYAQRRPRDPVAQLADAVARGAAHLTHEPGAGYLFSVLRELKISPESQLLVFSKTGLQRAATGPRTPRALYFNDSVVVGFIPGARFLEIASHDPEQGVIFYTVDQTGAPTDSGASPSASAHGAAPADTLRSSMGTTAPHEGGDARAGAVIARSSQCVTCHVSGSTMGVPGMITRSNFINESAGTLPQLGFEIVDHRTPLAKRWGGWFVTGNYVAPPYAGVGHMGNVMTTVHPARGDVAGTSNEVFLQWMDTVIDALGYPSHESDIAALMVFDHQMRAINLLTRLNWEARVASFEGEDAPSRPEVTSLITEVVDYFLFVDEAPPPSRITPRAGFAAHFSAAGPRDGRGRSLRDFDLERRLLRYPCSYMIHSEAFRHMPVAVRRAVYRRLADILRGRYDTTRRYAHLSADDRRAVLEILRSTIPDFRGSLVDR